MASSQWLEDEFQGPFANSAAVAGPSGEDAQFVPPDSGFTQSTVVEGDDDAIPNFPNIDDILSPRTPTDRAASRSSTPQTPLPAGQRKRKRKPTTREARHQAIKTTIRMTPSLRVIFLQKVLEVFRAGMLNIDRPSARKPAWQKLVELLNQDTQYVWSIDKVSKKYADERIRWDTLKCTDSPDRINGFINKHGAKSRWLVTEPVGPISIQQEIFWAESATGECIAEPGDEEDVPEAILSDQSDADSLLTPTLSTSSTSIITGRRKRQRLDPDINTTISDESDDDNEARQRHKRVKDLQREFSKKWDRKKQLTDLGSSIERASRAISRPIGATNIAAAMRLLQSDGFVKDLNWRLRMKAYDEIGSNTTNSVLYCQLSDPRERRLWLLTRIGAKIDDEEVKGDGVGAEGVNRGRARASRNDLIE
ncbi:uncharacterized protein BCR38DRAFT_473764 [Pseudomassariella vexata]|uniref:Uncharacterized protein n=1 Tax=Pseudomassariella vexata TaxID=1141098 RepID=A0A1Y2E4T2_9PEZI|nr:uncharacterized protein BCR38DRAFT_473764 [Pseudomassariella vexata]ORY66561.1 hypothetical protein BCR38DRAFT_473764 [Pseudomassariella vexata]